MTDADLKAEARKAFADGVRVERERLGSADPESWREHRPTPSQRLHEVTMAALTRPHAEPESAVEITRNAKGDFQFSVTVRGVDVHACETLARGVVERLIAQYPRGGEQA
jgi:hypothetical protein